MKIKTKKFIVLLWRSSWNSVQKKEYKQQF